MNPSSNISGYRARGGRVAYFDNVRFTLMSCVVIGHLLKNGGALKRRYARALFLLIYSFHMPLFVFVSGLFLHRRAMDRDKVLIRSGQFLALGMLAKVLRAVSPWLLGKPFHFDLINENGLPWFMFALACYYAVAWLLRNANAGVVAVISAALALLVGYIPAIGDAFCLSRIIVFFPFFWLGHILTPAQVRRVCTVREMRIVCAAVLALCALCCAIWTKSLWPYRKLFWGKLCYAATNIRNCSLLNRAAAYIMSLVSGVAVLGVVPQRRLGVLTLAGTRTLQVYLLHLEVIDILKHLRITRAIVHTGHWGWLLMIPLGIAINLVLSMPDIPVLVSKSDEHSR